MTIFQMELSFDWKNGMERNIHIVSCILLLIVNSPNIAVNALRESFGKEWQLSTFILINAWQYCLI